ncbi:phosphoesterase family-domain-containing protein [Obelidium mucronatum]|nr:phosphoesterase family-domain-containing protein [Obelidium mucronatum]
MAALSFSANVSTSITSGLIAFTWAGANTADVNDWIVFTTGSAPSRTNYLGENWQYLSGGQTKSGANAKAAGTLALRAPSSPGTYTAYFCLNAGYTCPASVSIKVSPMTLSAVNSSVITSGQVQFNWNGANPSDSNDWIVFTSSGAPSLTNYLSQSWAYTYGGQTKTGAAPTPSGSVSVRAPSTTGNFTAYYCLNGGYTCTATAVVTVSSFVLTSSASTVVAGGFISFSWTGANTASTNDWVVYSNGAPTRSSYFSDAWQYTYGTQDKDGRSPPASGSISVKAPAIPGTYLVSYCISDGFTCQASIPITVTAIQATCLPKSPKTAAAASTIEHVIIIISENHSFDNYFGRYCQAATNSKPSCNYGRSCCERGSESVDGVSPMTLTDASNKAYDPSHVSTNEICEINNGKMDKFIGSGGCSGSNDKNFAMANGTSGSASQYWKWADQYAMADRFFQSAVGQSCKNDMYFARDNSKVPPSDKCYIPFASTVASYEDPTIADFLVQCGVSWTFFAESLKLNTAPGECYPNYYDPSDNPFEYYPRLRSSAQASSYYRPLTGLYTDISAGTLPSVSWVKGLGINSEHPGISTISAGEKLNAGIINAILSSPTYQNNTIIIMTPDESGGYRDSVPPPPTSAIDNQMYGPRTPFVVVGNAVKKGGYISHVQMEPASIIRFIESNFLGGRPGQLQTRDAVVNNLGDLFDPALTGGFMFL